VKRKKQKKTDEKKKQKTPVSAEASQDATKEKRGLETDLDRELTASKKRRKAEKKQKSSTEFDLLTEAAVYEATTAKTSDLHYSSVVTAVDLSHSKRRPAKSDSNSGIVRIIEKSQRKRLQSTDDIEEALRLDVGIGSCQW